MEVICVAVISTISVLYCFKQMNKIEEETYELLAHNVELVEIIIKKDKEIAKMKRELSSLTVKVGCLKQSFNEKVIKNEEE